MLNEATLLEILLGYFWRLQQQSSVKKLRLFHLLFFLTLGNIWLFLVHGRILLNTRSLSGFFFGGEGCTTGRADSSVEGAVSVVEA
jgi:hypothetical protein